MNKNKNIDPTLIEAVVALAQDAGRKILTVYNAAGTIAVTNKTDHSPLTAADLAAHHCILAGLSALTPTIPVLSEESDMPDYTIRRQWQRYWLADPLDGTKEFISRNGEFTVNIALIEEGKPVLGVVYVPVSETTYVGIPQQGAYRLLANRREVLKTRSLQVQIKTGSSIDVLASRRHGLERLVSLCKHIEQEWGDARCTSVGSSLKMCLIAAGEADMYPRFGPTSEWDTAAAQAIVEAAGGSLVDQQLKPLMYNQKESIINPDFYAIGSDIALWQPLIEGIR
jgi:3'(2'), 5'-bisphosphate nucleotidase